MCTETLEFALHGGDIGALYPGDDVLQRRRASIG